MVKKVAAVQAAAPSLKKGERNEGAGFNFVGIDTFYEQIASLALDKGLTWVTVEDGIELVPTTTGEILVCQKFHADLLDTEDGTVAENFFCLTIPAPFSDAQTAGISLSYFDKALMRSLFKVVTGEKDADHMVRKRTSKPSKAETAKANAEDPLPELDEEPKAEEPKPEKVKKASKAKVEVTPPWEGDEAEDKSAEWKAIGDALMAKLNKCKTAADLEQFRVDEQGEINKLKTASTTDADADAEKQRVQKLFSAKYDEYSEEEE
jgi:hypothetical protein